MLYGCNGHSETLLKQTRDHQGFTAVCTMCSVQCNIQCVYSVMYRHEKRVHPNLASTTWEQRIYFTRARNPPPILPPTWVHIHRRIASTAHCATDASRCHCATVGHFKEDESLSRPSNISHLPPAAAAAAAAPAATTTTALCCCSGSSPGDVGDLASSGRRGACGSVLRIIEDSDGPHGVFVHPVEAAIADVQHGGHGVEALFG